VAYRQNQAATMRPGAALEQGWGKPCIGLGQVGRIIRSLFEQTGGRGHSPAPVGAAALDCFGLEPAQTFL